MILNDKMIDTYPTQALRFQSVHLNLYRGKFKNIHT